MKYKDWQQLSRRGMIALPLLFFVDSAWALPITVQVIGVVSLGENPKLVLEALSDTQNALIKLKREDGKSFTFPLGNLSAGQTKEIVLDGRAGRHNYTGTMSAIVDGEQLSSELAFKTVVAPPLQLKVDRNLLDLKAGRITFTASSALNQATLTVLNLDGSTVFEREFELTAAPANQPISLKYDGFKPDEIMRLELRVIDQDGFFKAIALTPWSLEIPHEEVLFASNSASIDATEEEKLQASLTEIKAALQRFNQIRGVQLFIAGHTDTVGTPSHNANLSRRRAQAIGNWFVQNNVPIPVYFEGFGETSLKVKTRDEVDEPRNRRADYILSVELPSLKSQAHGWKRLK